MARWHTLLILGALLLLLQGCSSIGFYWQAAVGQLQLQSAAKPIDEWLAADTTPAALKQKLELARNIRNFASDALSLPQNGSYTIYADLKRSAVVWNVFAAAPDSLTLKEFCFPIAGCVHYKGFFALSDASAFALELQQQGYDVHVSPVPAYSTLGWMTDPLLNTFIYYPEDALARLIFHELAHQVLYVPGDTTFNESFATAVEEIGLERWQSAYPNPEQNTASQQRLRMRKDFQTLLTQTKDALRLVFSAAEQSERLRGKKVVLDNFHTQYLDLKTKQWNGFTGYDHWFKGVTPQFSTVGNAHFASHMSYTQWVPAFKYLATQNNDLKQYFKVVKELSMQPKIQRNAYLSELNQRVMQTGSKTNTP